MLSFAMACRRRGAPVRDWSPAPTVEKNEPITMTQGEGQDRVPTTKFFLTASPNLKKKHMQVSTWGTTCLFTSKSLYLYALEIDFLLISQHHSLNTGPKKNHRAEICQMSHGIPCNFECKTKLLTVCVTVKKKKKLLDSSQHNISTNSNKGYRQER